MKTIKKIFIKELSPIWLLIASVVLFLMLSAFGTFHILCKCIFESFQKRFWKGIAHFFIYLIYVTYQIWNAIKYIFLHIAIGVDLLGNVTCGEAIEDLVTNEEKTMYGRGDITISTATGELEYHNKLNKLGLNFSKVLSKILDPNHCIESYKRWLHNKKFEL